MKKLRKLSALAFLAVGFALVFGGCNSSVAEIAVTGVTIDPASAEITVGETKQLVANVSPSNATNKNVTWLSDNPSVATVDKDGKVKGVAVGITTITVVTDDRSFPARCVVGVTDNQGNSGSSGGNGSSGGQTGGNASGSGGVNNSGNNGSTGGNTGSSGGQNSGNAGSDRPGDSDSSGNTGNPGTSSGGQTGGNASGSDSGNNSGNNENTGGNTGSSGGQSSGNVGSDRPGDSGSSGNEENTGGNGSSGGQTGGDTTGSGGGNDSGNTAKAGIIIGDTVYKFADLDITENYGDPSRIVKNSDGTLTVRAAGDWDQFNIPLPTVINISGKKIAITAKVASGYEQGEHLFKLVFAESDDKQSDITANKAAEGGKNEGWCDPLTTEFKTYIGSDTWTAYQKDEAADLTKITKIIINPQSGEGDITIQSIEFVD